MRQIYHPYWKWECHKAGMWRTETKDYYLYNIDKAIKFTGDYVAYGEQMLIVVDRWKYSTENFLTNKSINRRAYIGHAACVNAFGWPEYLVRDAWGKLSDLQRNLANKQADIAIRQFELKLSKNKSQLELW